MHTRRRIRAFFFFDFMRKPLPNIYSRAGIFLSRDVGRPPLRNTLLHSSCFPAQVLCLTVIPRKTVSFSRQKRRFCLRHAGGIHAPTTKYPPRLRGAIAWNAPSFHNPLKAGRQELTYAVSRLRQKKRHCQPSRNCPKPRICA